VERLAVAVEQDRGGGRFFHEAGGQREAEREEEPAEQGRRERGHREEDALAAERTTGFHG
jgi:hypothetical protein